MFLPEKTAVLSPPAFFATACAFFSMTAMVAFLGGGITAGSLRRLFSLSLFLFLCLMSKSRDLSLCLLMHLFSCLYAILKGTFWLALSLWKSCVLQGAVTLFMHPLGDEWKGIFI